MSPPFPGASNRVQSSLARSRQRGAAGFLLGLMLLAALAIVGVVSTDLSRMIEARHRLQAVLDEALMRSVRLLPDEDAARSMLGGLTRDFGTLDAAWEGTGVSASLVAPHTLYSVAFLGALAGSTISSTLDVRVEAGARIRAADLLVAFDASQAVAPRLGERSWSSGAVRPAQFFSQLVENGTVDAARSALLRTEECFNPVFSLVKAGVLESLYLGRRDGARSGAVVFPALSPWAASDDLVPLGEGSFETVYAPDYASAFGADRWCAEAERREQPGTTSALPRISAAFARLGLAPARGIWSTSVRHERHVPSFSSLLDSLAERLGGEPLPSFAADGEVGARQRVIILSAAFPEVSGAAPGDDGYVAGLVEAVRRWRTVRGRGDAFIARRVTFVFVVSPRLSTDEHQRGRRALEEAGRILGESAFRFIEILPGVSTARPVPEPLRIELSRERVVLLTH